MVVVELATKLDPAVVEVEVDIPDFSLVQFLKQMR
tara:strand:+ start:221 stop:325 length:105 start_codon:yes stop_codon:yes gene_type:complete